MPATVLLVSRNSPGTSTAALRVGLGADGRTYFTPVGEDAPEALAMIGNGVFSARARRLVTPAEGEQFLQAVYEMFIRSTAWSVSAEAATG